MRPYLLLIAILFCKQSFAQLIYGTIRYRDQSGEVRPDIGTTIYLCQRSDVDIAAISKMESASELYDLSTVGTTAHMRKHRMKLEREYKVRNKQDLEKYMQNAAKEEAKIIADKDAIIRHADSAGEYDFKNVKEGYYFLFIKSANTHRSAIFNFDFTGHDELVADRVFTQAATRPQ